jgi:hypothetical protein
MANFTRKKKKKISNFFSNCLFEQELKICPPKNHCWHYVKNPLYLWIFSIFNSKSSTTNNHFKLGEFFYICMYMHIHITFTWNCFFLRNWIFLGMCLSILHGQVDFGIIPHIYVRNYIIKVMVYYVYVFIYLGHPNLHTSFHLPTFLNMNFFLSNNSPPK